MERLERAIEAIQSTVEEDGGNLVLKMKVCEMLLVLFRILLIFNSRKRSLKQMNKILLN